MTKQNVKRPSTKLTVRSSEAVYQRTQTQVVPHNTVHAYLIHALNLHLTAMHQDLIECEQVRLRTEADIKHVRGQIAALKRKCTSDTSTERRAVCPNGASAPQTQARSAGLSAQTAQVHLRHKHGAPGCQPKRRTAKS